jgi:hypothetical protein
MQSRKDRYAQATAAAGAAFSESTTRRVEKHPVLASQRDRVRRYRSGSLSRCAADGRGTPCVVGEVRQSLPARRMFLAQDQLALGALSRPPVRDTALQPVGIAARVQRCSSSSSVVARRLGMASAPASAPVPAARHRRRAYAEALPKKELARGPERGGRGASRQALAAVAPGRSLKTMRMRPRLHSFPDIPPGARSPLSHQR